MMHTDFEAEFRKLKTKWKTFYTDAMEEEAFLLVKDCPAEAFEKFVRKAMWTREAPNLEAFVEFKNKNRIARAEVFTNCGECDGRGNLSATSDENYDYWFACIECEAGQRKHFELPRWSPRWLDHGWKVNRQYRGGA